MKKLISTGLALLLLISVLLAPACAVVEQSESYYVADYANVLSSDVEQQIIDANAKLEQTCDGAQIVVVTIDYLPDNYYADEYARQLFNNWHVGSADANNGILLLLVTQEAKGWLVTGAGLSNKLTNQEVDDLLNDYFWDYVDDGKYEKAVTSVFDQLLNWYEDEYNTALTQPGTSQNYNQSSYQTEYRRGPSPFMMLVIFIIVISLLNSSARRVRRRGSDIPWWVWWMMCNDRGPRGPRGGPPPPGGFGGFGGGGFHGGGGFGGGMGHGGGGFSGGGGGRR